MGTPDECAALVDELRAATRVQVVEVSSAYPNRRSVGELVRVYVEVRLVDIEAGRAREVAPEPVLKPYEVMDRQAPIDAFLRGLAGGGQ